MKRIKLYTFYNSEFSLIKDRFFASIRDDYEIHCVQKDLGPGNAWCGGINIWLFKAQYIIDSIKKNRGDIILVTDIDIQFFKPTEEIVLESIQGNDMVFQENPFPWHKIQPVCIGFMAIRCNKRTLKFWKTVLKLVKKTKKHDQQIVCDLLEIPEGIQPNNRNRLPIKYSIFPPTIWAWGPNDEWIENMPKDIVLHHATGAKTQNEKLAQMNKIKTLVYVDRSTP